MRGWAVACPRLPQPQPLRLPHRRAWEGVPPDLAETFDALAAGREAWPFTLIGGVGTGKTCGALAFLDRLAGARSYSTLEDLIFRVAESKANRLSDGNGDRITPSAIWRAWERAAITCLDEVGAGRQKITDLEFDVLKRALDLRTGRPSIWISNLDVGQLATLYDQRIASRLGEGTVLIIDGPDRRLPPP